MPLGRAVQAVLFVAPFLAPVGYAHAQQQMPCANEILPLRNTVEKAGMAVKAAIDKRDRGEICSRMKAFAAVEAKFVKYLETNGNWCSIPSEVVQQAKASHGRTLTMRTQACAAGPVGRQGPPPGPGLSEALGTSRTPVIGENKNDRGTYNTLTGNPLQR
ncbi:MAG: hypothetical protein IT538_06555 [Variibacter sp.]|nr:hypothetical protein [Variibacter sp.]